MLTNRPIALSLIAAAFIFQGIEAIVGMIGSFSFGKVNINLMFLLLFAGIGLLRLSDGWRKFTLACLGLVAVAMADAFHLGVLSSRLHVGWALASGGTLEDRPVYSKSRCFDPFPFPDLDPAGALAERIRTLAEHIDAHLLDIPEQHDAAKGLAALSLYAEASAIDAPGFAVADGTLDAEAELNGLPDSLTTFFGPELLRHIQQAGGKLNIVGLRGADETTSFELTGNLGLDAEMRTDGQLHLVSNGLVERLNGLIPAQMQPLIVGQPAEDGSYSQTLTFKSGVIFSGLVPVGMVPPLM